LLFLVLWYNGLRSIVVGQFPVMEAVLMSGAWHGLIRDTHALEMLEERPGKVR
jgi:hypothetical protein